MCSVKVVFVGDTRSGKTSLISSLISGSPTMSCIPTEGVEQHIWKPQSQDMFGKFEYVLPLHEVW